MQKIIHVSVFIVFLQFFSITADARAMSNNARKEEKKTETYFPWLFLSSSIGVQFWDSGNRDFEGKVFTFHLAPILAFQGDALISYGLGYIALSGSLPVQPLDAQAEGNNIIRFSGGIFQRISRDPFFHLVFTFNYTDVSGEIITPELEKDFAATQYITELTLQGHPEGLFSPKVGARYKRYNTPAALITVGGTKTAPTNFSVLYENVDANDIAFIAGLSMKRKKLFIWDFNVAGYMGSTLLDRIARQAVLVRRGGMNFGAYGTIGMGVRLFPWEYFQGGVTVNYDWDWHYFSAGEGVLEGTPDAVTHFRPGKVMQWEDVLHTLRVSLLVWW